MNLITLTVEGGELELGKDFSIRFAFALPLPFSPNIPVASSYWFNFPASDANNVVLKHSNNRYVTKTVKSYSLLAKVDNIVMNGILLIKNAGNREYKAFVVLNDIIDQLGNKQVSEAVSDVTELGANTDAIVLAAKTMSQTVGPDQKYAFAKVRNDTFFADTNEDYTTNGKHINNYSPSAAKYGKNYVSGDIIYNRHILIPFPYLNFIIKNIFETIGWTVTGAMMDDEDFHKLIYYNNYSLENSKDENYLPMSKFDYINIGLPSIKHLVPFNFADSDELGNFNPETSEFSCSKTATFYFNISFQFYFNYSEEFTLYFYIYDGTTYTELLHADYAGLGPGYYSWEENLNGSFAAISGKTYKMYYEVSTYFADATLSQIDFKWTPNTIGLDRFANRIKLKNHVPRITVSEMLQQVARKFDIAVFFDFENKTVELEQWNNIIDNQNYIDLTSCVIKDTEDISVEEKHYAFTTAWENDDMIEGNFKDVSEFKSVTSCATYDDLPTPGIINQLCLVKSINKYYVTVLDQALNVLKWKISFDNFYPIKSDYKDAIEINTIINTLFNRIYVLEDENIIYPEIQQHGTNAEMGQNDQGFKLLNYHGFVTDYPFASNTIYSPTGAKLSGIPLQLHGTDGTYDRYGKKLYQYLEQSKPEEMNLKINAAQFGQIIKLYSAQGASNKTRKIRIGNKNYLPETCDITVNLREIDICKLKLI